MEAAIVLVAVSLCIAALAATALLILLRNSRRDRSRSIAGEREAVSRIIAITTPPTIH